MIINYIDKVHYATTKNIAELFFKGDSKNYYILAINRLKKLVQYGKINCMSANINNIGRPMTIYFMGKPISKTKLKHALALADFSAELKKCGADIVSVEKEICYGEKIRADGLYKVIYNGNKRLFIVEFDITKKFNMTKYEYFYRTEEWKQYFKKFPRIVSVSDSGVPYSRDIKVLSLNSKLTNIEILLNALE